MIVAEHSLRAIISKIPKIQMNFEEERYVKFGWGDRFELDRYLLKLEDNAYPLIWLLPSTDNHENYGKIVKKDCVLLIATRETRKDMFNDQRFVLSYEIILNPLVNFLIHGLKVSNITNIDESWDIDKFPNYSEATENYTIDLWDAIRLKTKVTFTDNLNCLKNIKF